MAEKTAGEVLGVDAVEEFHKRALERRVARRTPGRAPQPARAPHAGDLAGYLREREGDDTVEV